MKRVRMAALIVSGFAASLAVPGAAIGQGAPAYGESVSDSLARNVRILGGDPKDFNALVGAGKAALKLGDAQAAAGFFGRAAEVSPNSPLPQSGMGAALVATGDPGLALTYFARAQQLGASVVSFGSDRGLAYDLLGNQAAAQSDYRAALAGADRDEARRRLALSLAISGNTTLALSTLQPLVQTRDVAAQRVRALVLALGGDLLGAKSALDYTMPGASARMDPFFRRLPTLSSVQKAAAVHLGIFPESGSAMAAANDRREDRLASIEQLLTRPQDDQPQAPRYAYAAAPPAAEPGRPPIQMASISRPAIKDAASASNAVIQTARVASDPNGKKIWLQLATGSNPGELPGEFRKIRSREPSLFTDINGFVADTGSRSRLLIGPFHTQEDAQLFADALQSARIDSFSWTSQPGQVVRKLPTK